MQGPVLAHGPYPLDGLGSYLRDILWPNTRRQHGGSFIIKRNGKKVIEIRSVMWREPYSDVCSPKGESKD